MSPKTTDPQQTPTETTPEQDTQSNVLNVLTQSLLGGRTPSQEENHRFFANAGEDVEITSTLGALNNLLRNVKGANVQGAKMTLTPKTIGLLTRANNSEREFEVVRDEDTNGFTTRATELNPGGVATIKGVFTKAESLIANGNYRLAVTWLRKPDNKTGRNGVFAITKIGTQADYVAHFTTWAGKVNNKLEKASNKELGKRHPSELDVAQRCRVDNDYANFVAQVVQALTAASELNDGQVVMPTLSELLGVNVNDDDDNEPEDNTNDGNEGESTE